MYLRNPRRNPDELSEAELQYQLDSSEENYQYLNTIRLARGLPSLAEVIYQKEPTSNNFERLNEDLIHRGLPPIPDARQRILEQEKLGQHFWGYFPGLPAGVMAAWGCRAILHNGLDLVNQSMVSVSDETGIRRSSNSEERRDLHNALHRQHRQHPGSLLLVNLEAIRLVGFDGITK